MLYDCFPFFNELDLMEIRLATLEGVVDRFVIAECPWTHQGREKPLHFAENRDRFARWLPMIEHLVIEDRPGPSDPMVLEPFHRECLARGLALAEPNDLAMISDLDEIPSSEAVDEARRIIALEQLTAVSFEQALYYYYADCYQCQCTGTRLARVKAVRAIGPQRIRHSDWPVMRRDGEPNWGGWHFSYLGGKAAIRAKTAAFCHPGCADGKFMSDANLDEALSTGVDLYGRNADGRFVPVDETWPKHLLANRERFAHLIKET